MRIALLGGSFDPIHNAHIKMAMRAKQQLALDEVWFLIAKDTPLKDRKLTSYAHREAMCEIALQPYRDFKICTIEKDMAGKSYSINTVRKIKTMYPDDTFFFLIGADQAKQLHEWKEVDALVKEVQVCAFARANEEVTCQYDITLLTMEAHNESSTAIRAGKFHYVHPNVRKYIVRNGLYLDFIKDVMSEYRYTHSVSVANLCREIAHANHLDEHKALLCGMLHDINKEFQIIDIKASEAIIKVMQPKLLNYSQKVWHGFIGAYVCAHQLGIKDKDILLAIENHVLGECKNPYAMLLYVSDKLDPLRDFDTSIGINICKQSLLKGYQYVIHQQDEYFGKDNARGE